MRVSDDKLMQCIWVSQLRNLARNAIVSDGNGHWALKPEDEWECALAALHDRTHCQRITGELEASQLHRRIRRLCDRGQLRSLRTQSVDGFFIAGDLAMEAYREARRWWARKGAGKRGVSMPRSLDAQYWACEDHLIGLFGHQDFREETKAAA